MPAFSPPSPLTKSSSPLLFLPHQVLDHDEAVAAVEGKVCCVIPAYLLRGDQDPLQETSAVDHTQTPSKHKVGRQYCTRTYVLQVHILHVCLCVCVCAHHMCLRMCHMTTNGVSCVPTYCTYIPASMPVFLCTYVATFCPIHTHEQHAHPLCCCIL